MGHSSFQLTVDTYAHLIRVQTSFVDRLDDKPGKKQLETQRSATPAQPSKIAEVKTAA